MTPDPTGDQAREAVERMAEALYRFDSDSEYTLAERAASTQRRFRVRAQLALEASGLLSPNKPPDFRFVSTDELRAELASRPDADDPVSCGKPCDPDPDIGAARCALPRFHGGPCSSDKPEGHTTHHGGRDFGMSVTRRPDEPEGQRELERRLRTALADAHQLRLELNRTEGQRAVLLDEEEVAALLSFIRGVYPLRYDHLVPALEDKLRASSPDSEERRNLERFSVEDWERLRRRQSDPETQERSITAWRDEADPEGGDRG